MKKFLSLCMAAVMVFALVACGGNTTNNSTSGNSSNSGSTDDAGSTAATFKIGVIGPQTGDAAIYGTHVAWAAQIAVDEINALGGDIQFELMVEDDVNDAETSVNA